MLNFRKSTLILYVFFMMHCSPTINNCLCQWVPVTQGMGNLNIYSLTCSGSNIFAGTLGHGVYLSSNTGTNWIHIGLDSQNVRSLIVSGKNIFAGTQANGIYLSSDEGTNWTQTQIDNQVVLSFGINGNNIFAGTVANGVYLSLDNGSNWMQSTLDNQNIYSIAVQGGSIFAGTVNGFKLSTDNCISWAQTSLISRNVISSAQNGNVIFAGTYIYGVYLSSDEGNTWIQSSLNDQHVYSLAVSGDNVFAGTHSPPFSFYFSPDNGVSWTGRSEGLINPMNITALCVMNNYIFAGTDGHGVYKRPLSELTGITTISNEVPDKFILSQNYPNPFNPSTKIKFSIPNSQNTTLKIYDALGKELETLVNEHLSAGYYETDWDASNYPSGFYFYTLNSEKFSKTKKMFFLK